ncbi:sugar ABC transporter substrate-binding protein [Nakamurella leprariae]|uniref:Maltose ABC transporter substrate-binding protein n=1 Tax=Nakamurella leprariae TaxID=2803911 RepID=A0A938YDI7_9ACTN|nr:maltose ABC transporter substrate-binding protein [Nakamurella leprariae]MBM9466447.1 maltose ABC transporter substrate-binding protein [Nakamurella leprariae]
MRSRHARLIALGGIVALLVAACGGSDDGGGGTTAATSAAGAGTATSAATGTTAEESPATTGGGAPAGSAAGTLTIWTDALYAPPVKEAADAFAAENGVTVNVQAVNETRTQFLTASQAGTGPDLVLGANDWIGQLVQNGAIDPVPMTDATKDLFNPAAIQAVTFNGQVYGIPYAVENLALYRNTDLAPEAPATWEDLTAAATSLQQQGRVTELLALPIGTDGAPAPYHTYPIFTAGGGTLFGESPDGSYDINQMEMGSDASIAANTRMSQMAQQGLLKTSIGSENLASIFTDQKTAFMVSGPWTLPDIEAAGINYAISDIPSFAGGPPARPFLGVQAVYVASKGQNKALAQEFATNYFIQPEVAQGLYDAQPRPPALLETYESVAAENPDIAAFNEAGAEGDPLPSFTEMAGIFDPWGKAIVAIVGGADPAQTTRDLATTIDGLIGG